MASFIRSPTIAVYACLIRPLSRVTPGIPKRRSYQVGAAAITVAVARMFRSALALGVRKVEIVSQWFLMTKRIAWLARPT